MCYFYTLILIEAENGLVCFCRYLGDGRFHLESIMIANPEIPAYRYSETKWHYLTLKCVFSNVIKQLTSPK